MHREGVLISSKENVDSSYLTKTIRLMNLVSSYAITEVYQDKMCYVLFLNEAIDIVKFLRSYDQLDVEITDLIPAILSDLKDFENITKIIESSILSSTINQLRRDLEELEKLALDKRGC